MVQMDSDVRPRVFRLTSSEILGGCSNGLPRRPRIPVGWPRGSPRRCPAGATRRWRGSARATRAGWRIACAPPRCNARGGATWHGHEVSILESI